MQILARHGPAARPVFQTTYRLQPGTKERQSPASRTYEPLLTHDVLVMARSFKALPQASGREAGALTSMLSPEQVLEAICSHMASAGTDDPFSPGHELLLPALRRLCEGIRHRILNDGNAAEPNASG